MQLNRLTPAHRRRNAAPLALTVAKSWDGLASTTVCVRGIEEEPCLCPRRSATLSTTLLEWDQIIGVDGQSRDHES
jgi:hypothetical protein